MNQKDQAGGATPQNEPEALRSLLRNWKTSLGPGGATIAITARRDVSGTIVLELAATGRQQIVVERSFDLHQWNPIHTNVLDARGLGRWTFDPAASGQFGYFRAFASGAVPAQ